MRASESLVERFPVREQADLEHMKAFERVAPFGEHGARGAPRRHADFHRANHFGKVIGMDARGSRGVEAAEQAMGESGPARFAVPQASAEDFIPLRTRREAIHERAQIETRAAGHNGEMTATRDLPKRAAAQACEIARGEQFVGIDDVDQVMGNFAAFGFRKLGGADIEVAENLHGIAVDHFALRSPPPAERPVRSCRSPSDRR